MAREEVTSIEVKKSTWKTLNQQKEPGDSFDDVVQRLLARPEPGEVPQEPPETDADETASQEPHDDARTCPDCGRHFDSVPELLEHVRSTDPDHGP